MGPDFPAIEVAYGAALVSQGAGRLDCFIQFGELAEHFAAERLYAFPERNARYGLSYGNLMHNFFGSLTSLRMIHARRDFLLSLDRYGPVKMAEAEKLSDAVLVKNGESALELLRIVCLEDRGLKLPSHEGNATTGGAVLPKLDGAAHPQAA